MNLIFNLIVWNDYKIATDIVIDTVLAVFIPGNSHFKTTHCDKNEKKKIVEENSRESLYVNQLLHLPISLPVWGCTINSM